MWSQPLRSGYGVVFLGSGDKNYRLGSLWYLNVVGKHDESETRFNC